VGTGGVGQVTGVEPGRGGWGDRAVAQVWVGDGDDGGSCGGRRGEWRQRKRRWIEKKFKVKGELCDARGERV
jgi:hypothetical protein